MKYVGHNAHGMGHVWQLVEIFVWWKGHYGGEVGHARGRSTTTFVVTKEAQSYEFLQTNNPICVHTRRKQVVPWFCDKHLCSNKIFNHIRKHVGPKGCLPWKAMTTMSWYNK